MSYRCVEFLIDYRLPTYSREIRGLPVPDLEHAAWARHSRHICMRLGLLFWHSKISR